MADSTDATHGSEEACGWCNWCQTAAAVRRISTTPRASGGDSAANSLYACADCRTKHTLIAIDTPVAS